MAKKEARASYSVMTWPGGKRGSSVKLVSAWNKSPWPAGARIPEEVLPKRFDFELDAGSAADLKAMTRAPSC